MSDKPAPQHLFADVLARVHAVCAALAAEGQWPAGIDFSRVVVEPPRDASHGDMATNAAMVLAKDAKAKPRELADKIAEKLRADDLVASVEVAGPGFINLTLKPQVWADELRAMLREGASYGKSAIGHGAKVNVEYVSANPTGPMHVGHCRGAVFGDALCSLLAFRRLRRHARILHQRRRRAGRRARALGIPALPRSARREHRRDSGRAVSRRLSRAGRPGARGRAWRQAQGDAGDVMAADRARQVDRHDDGHDQGRSRRAQHQARGVLLGAVADRDRQQQGHRDHRFPARQGRHLRGPPAAAEGQAGRGLRGPDPDAVPRHRLWR